MTTKIQAISIETTAFSTFSVIKTVNKENKAIIDIIAFIDNQVKLLKSNINFIIK
jgi:hypothetical protein